MRRGWIVVAVVLLTAFAVGDFERGNRYYRSGEYHKAVDAYRAALRGGNDSPALHYNLGTALLRLDRYERAGRHLQHALETVDPELRRRVLYNLGNRYLAAARDSAPPSARGKLLDAAVETYKRALRLAPADSAAKWNYELALRERERQRRRHARPQARERPPEQRRQGQPRAENRGRDDGTRRAPSARSERPEPRPAQGAMTREQARRILRAVAQDERELYEQKLRKGRRETPVARDW